MNSRPKASRPKVPWSRADKFLMFVLGLVLPLALGTFLWLRALDRNPDLSIPTPPMPATNARDYYIAAGNAAIDGDKIGFAVGPWNPATRPSGDNHFYSPADKEKLVAENAGAVKTLHAGFQYPYQEPPYRSFSAIFPHYQKIRALARLLSLQAQVEAAKGNWAASINTDLDAVQIGEQLPHGGPMIGMLVGDACQSIGRKGAWGTAGRLDSAQARAAARRLEIIRTGHVPFADTLQEEEWGVQGSLMELMRKPGWPADLLTSMAPDQQQDQTASSWLVAARIRLAGKRTIMANYTRYMDQSIADARRPYAAHPAPLPEPTDPISQILLPIYAGARLNEVKADTQNALLLVTLALRTYKMDHGTYPLALAALTPHYLQAVPADPFAVSGPLRYKRTGARYLLYSVGPDGRDDGGRAIFDRAKPAPSSTGASDPRYLVNENSQGDIVAGVNTN